MLALQLDYLFNQEAYDFCFNLQKSLVLLKMTSEALSELYIVQITSTYLRSVNLRVISRETA